MSKLLVTALAIIAVLAAPASPQASCTDITIPVTATAINKAIPTNLNVTALVSPNTDLNQVRQTLLGLPELTVTGAYTISARYCQPAVQICSKQSALQVLVHGATYTKSYWSALSPVSVPNSLNYDYISYATSHGYSTLSIDRICNGQSSHPDALTTCQIPMNAAIVAEIISSARSGTLHGLPHAFSKVVYIGHSLGSLTGNYIAQSQPTLVDAWILTGFTANLITGLAGILAEFALLPAAVAWPEKYSAYALDPEYQLATSKNGTTFLFYEDNYDPSVASLDYQNRGTITLGEAITSIQGQAVVSGVTAPVLVYNGEFDTCFCAREPSDAVAHVKGECGAMNGAPGFTQKTGDLYPNAKFQWGNAQAAGHCSVLHDGAMAMFGVWSDFLQAAEL